MKLKNLVTIIVILFIKFLFEFVYIQIINPLFEYDGFILNINFYKMIESYILVLFVFIPVVYLLEDKKLPSKVVVYLLSIFLFLPMSSVLWLQDKTSEFLWVIATCIVIMALALTILPSIKFIKLKEGKKLLFMVIGVMTLIVYGILIGQGGLTRINLNLLNVYETRSDYASTNNFLLGYLLPWQAYGVNMVALAIALYKKKYKLIIVILFMQVILFSMTNFKSFLFAPIVLLGFHIFSKTRFKNNLLLVISLGCTFLITLSIMIYYFVADIFLISVFVRRLFLVPANLHYIYYDFFNEIEKYKLSHSILSGLFNNPYNLNPVKLVAENYFNKDFAPNVGFFGDAFLNFGLFGILLFAILLIIVLKIIDTVSVSTPISLSMTIITIPAMALINSAFFTALLTHGILFAIFLLWLVNSYFLEDIKEKDKDKDK